MEERASFLWSCAIGVCRRVVVRRGERPDCVDRLLACLLTCRRVFPWGQHRDHTGDWEPAFAR